MNARLLTAGLAVSAFAMTACTFMARGPEDYQKDTRAVLEGKNGEIQTCYNDALKQNKDAKGTVVVHFLVQPETGKITDVSVLPESTAPEPLGNCVVAALDGLALDPPDERQGSATFAYDFQ